MAHLLTQDQIVAILSTYGYWAIFIVVALESSGLPLPGETILIGAAIYANLSGHLAIESIVLAAAAGAIIGDNIGYWIGREFGTKLLERYGGVFGIGPKKLLLGQYLFLRWGGSIVFFGRFIALMRILAAVLAGANRLDPPRFFFFNATGGVVWALVFGYGAYYLTAGFEKVQGPVGAIVMLCLLIGIFTLWRYYKTHEERFMREAEAALKPRGRRAKRPSEPY
jgi:membrane protein DedA with SNARE-associated domain